MFQCPYLLIGSLYKSFHHALWMQCSQIAKQEMESQQQNLKMLSFQEYTGRAKIVPLKRGRSVAERAAAGSLWKTAVCRQKKKKKKKRINRLQVTHQGWTTCCGAAAVFHIKPYLFNIKDMYRQNWACLWTHTFIFDSVHTHINASEHHDTTHLFSSVKLSLPLVSG